MSSLHAQDDVDLGFYFSRHTLDVIDRIFLLSRYHQRGTPSEAAKLVEITRNGLDPALFVDGPNHQHMYIYASAPNR